MKKNINTKKQSDETLLKELHSVIAAMKKKGVACGTGDEIDEIRKRKK
jgi:hypothetical protein